MRRRSDELGPKIVQIETRYVETDAVNFRDVVQSLTGKNSSTDWIGRRRRNYADAPAPAAASSSMVTAGSEIKRGAIAGVNGKPAAEECVLPSSMLMNSVSFKDFDRFLFEFPTTTIQMDEMPWL